MKRRDFIRNGMLASGAFMLPSFLKPFESMALADVSGFRNLVIIQLSGGNDGLNTIVPFGNDEYYKNRQIIGIPPSELLKMNSMQGLNPALVALRPIYDQGFMTILNGVGYPNPDRSHFISMDIWQTASASDEYLSSGWIGRYLDSNCETCKHPFSAIEVDNNLSLALKGNAKKGLALTDIDKLYNTLQKPYFMELTNKANENLNENNLGYLYKTLIETSSSASYIHETSKVYKQTGTYPETAFANQLATISQFINSGLKTRVYYVSLSGFDTHTNQRNQQSRLLKIYGDAVAAFVNDLKSTGKLEDTMVMTFSEFGRRVSENNSKGTDHGTANNVLLFGGKLKKAGIYNDAPDLINLKDGDLKHQLDFRSVYATLLENWLEVKSSSILNAGFERLNFV